MTVAIMQPYFFPYLGYFQLILAADRGVVLDVVKYNRKSWMNRNRILHPNGGWQYISVPVHAPQGSLIQAATIMDAPQALRRILGQLDHYRKKAPFFAQVCRLVCEAFEATANNKMRDLSVHSLAAVCRYLDIDFKWSLFSEMGLDIPAIEHPGQWALEICSALNASRYVNAPGGRAIFIPQEWEERGIELNFLGVQSFIYATPSYVFEENLSILDVLMWNDAATVRNFMSETLSMSG